MKWKIKDVMNNSNGETFSLNEDGGELSGKYHARKDLGEKHIQMAVI